MPECEKVFPHEYSSSANHLIPTTTSSSNKNERNLLATDIMNTSSKKQKLNSCMDEINDDEQATMMTNNMIKSSTVTFSQLPYEIYVHMMEFLDIDDVLTCSLINLRFNEICNCNVVWRKKCQDVFLIPNVVFEQKGILSAIETRTHANLGNDNMTTLEADEQELTDMMTITPPPLSELFISPNSVSSSKEFDPILDKMNMRQSERIEDLLTNVFGPENKHRWCKMLFIQYFKTYVRGVVSNKQDFQKACEVFRKMKRLVNQLEYYLGYHSPKIYASLFIIESTPNMFEYIESQKTILQKDFKDLPLEFKYLYLLTDGQRGLKSKSLGLFGMYEFYSYLAALPFISLRTNCKYLEEFRSQEYELVDSTVPFIISSNVNILIVTKPFTCSNYSYLPGNVIQLTAQGIPFVLHQSFAEWFETYVVNLTVKELFDIEESGAINRFFNSQFGSETITNGVKITCQSLLIPEMTQITETESLYHFSYRVKITMDKDETNDKSCRLQSRHWEIFEGGDMENEEPEVVDGPGVVGLFPKVVPGSVFSYCSCTQSSSEIGYMRGFFVMQKLNDGTIFNAMIDPFPISIQYHV
ncbi:hypothetical protein C9374_010518 [Naegleria lovaniensis]|uniref:F-box domain-containing protein n=1 Tax=Naegleria lovaniensis TaxID=51637 RepID=A0AA88GHQ4_NAELO|nr:uncharacterized protein C9374_010518 [Naegleria lovaniensis]KAG2374774.1 hypothetical protein C9374_010518 [Naegleria lovaniensis]